MTDTGRVRQPIARTLERGRFSDGVRTFSVRASSGDAPDSFQVYTDGGQGELVLVITGLISRELRASWSLEWRSASDSWREWLEANAFMVFYNGDRPAIGKVRVCNG